MRKLIILRGVMGSGKSTFVKENNLDIYTLSTDKIRLMFNSPELTINYNETIPQFNNKKVWNLLLTILEERMKKGEFTVVDAMHIKKDDLAVYKKLAGKYRYRLFIVDFSDVSIEELKKRNKSREENKMVLEKSIDRAFRLINKEKIPSSFNVIKPDNFKDIIKNSPRNCDNYDNIHIIGDIHGCYSVLNRLFEENPIQNNDLYIFLGDYFDKGIENFKTYEFLNRLTAYDNMIFLLGNHEDKLYKYACDDEFIMDYSISKTIEDFEKNGVKKSEIRGFIKQLAQMSYIQFRENLYLITHGGISYFPSKPLDFYSTNSFIYGIDKYEVNIDKIYNSFMEEQENKIYQIHGHRNFDKIDYDEYKYSINLDGNIENGGNLRVLTLKKDGSKVCHLIKNNTYNSNLIENENIYNLVYELRNSKYIFEKDLGNNTSSFNFTKDAFYNGIWNTMTMQARGLFLNTKEYKVIARSYNKFFNIDENKETKLDAIIEKLTYPTSFYLKYNGFLGILSLNSDELFFASKSNIEGPHVDYFKTVFNSKFNKKQIEAIKNMMSEKNVSLIFEVIDPINDPHIIEYEESDIVLLDAIRNIIDYSKMPFTELKIFADKNNIQVKENVYSVSSRDEFLDLYNKITEDDYQYKGKFIEGFVIEDNDGFMVKFKTNYYKKWKYLRTKMESAIKNDDFKIKYQNVFEKNFMEYLEKKYKGKNIDISDINIIDERNDYFNK